MLSFLVGVLDSDRKESAKSNAQEELQAAIGYIADDLQEAVYIYGSTALAGINSQLPHSQSGAGNECNPAGTNTCTPILVFWKRFAYEPNTEARYSATPAAAAVKIGCMPYSGNAAAYAACINPANAYAGNAFGANIFTYSLVAYYLKDDRTAGNNGFSNTARILRWEIKDGYAAYCSNGTAISATNLTCPSIALTSTRANSDLITTPVVLTDPTRYFILPSSGFNRPDFGNATGTLSTIAAGWRKYTNFDFSAATGDPFVTLVDFMDDTVYSTNQGGNLVATGSFPVGATAAIKIPIGRNDTSVSPATNLDCNDPSVGVGTTDPVSVVTQRVPDDFASATSNPSQLTSFYACVAPESVTARIYMRGNALARMGSNFRAPNDNNLSFFPTADVRAFGRSGIGLKKQ